MTKKYAHRMTFLTGLAASCCVSAGQMPKVDPDVATMMPPPPAGYNVVVNTSPNGNIDVTYVPNGKDIKSTDGVVHIVISESSTPAPDLFSDREPLHGESCPSMLMQGRLYTHIQGFDEVKESVVTCKDHDHTSHHANIYLHSGDEPGYDIIANYDVDRPYSINDVYFLDDLMDQIDLQAMHDSYSN